MITNNIPISSPESIWSGITPDITISEASFFQRTRGTVSTLAEVTWMGVTFLIQHHPADGFWALDTITGIFYGEDSESADECIGKLIETIEADQIICWR